MTCYWANRQTECVWKWTWTGVRICQSFSSSGN